ncbi:MAG: ammonium transporter [Pelagibacteraceae bacterium]|jgi:Amt family ammonium transporter|nr:ammonium transporter [Pelagibacteraceae bacterium]MDP6727197.1 ammonium transporter [Candidatus Neomarinimicrobiota bacterium]
MNAGDTAWMLTSTCLVLLMTLPGVALLYGGMVSKKNIISTITQTFMITCLVTLLWFIVGYSLSFSEGSFNNFVGGFSNLFLKGVGVESLSGTIPESVFVVFQLTFAIITAALICGAVAERMNFLALVIFITIWILLVYAPICHMVWGGGLLASLGVLDFAGGTVVHINCGIAGLVAAIVLGERKKRSRPHNLLLSLIGTSLLWVGWFGFNAGSAVAANGGAGMAMLVTQIATATAGLAWMFAEWGFGKKPSLLGILSGAIAGLVAITPAAGFVGPVGAFFIGLIAGIACYWASTKLKNKFGYDDSLDVFGIHGVGGTVGAILTGIFAKEAIGGAAGLLEGNTGQLWLQFIGVAFTIVYTGVLTFVILKIVNLITPLRATPEEETQGLDLNQHGEQVS